MDGNAVEIFFKFFSIHWFVTGYTIPTILFVVLYGQVIYAFYKRRSKAELASSRVIDKATSELTKTAIIVTAIFIVALGYESWYYMLGYNDVVPYVKNTPIQKVGIGTAAFNSACNPFVYGTLVPAYRKCLQLTFCRYLRKH